jgi:hypothetical protein
MAKRRKECALLGLSSKLDCVSIFCLLQKQLIDSILFHVVWARSDITARLVNDKNNVPTTLVMGYLAWGEVPDYEEFVHILKDICRRNSGILRLYTRIPGLQHGDLWKGARKKLHKVRGGEGRVGGRGEEEGEVCVCVCALLQRAPSPR